ncbi:SAP domain-containing protein [Methanobrevibacter sp.]
MFNETTLGKFSLKYPNKVPNGYDVSQMQYTFDFIYLVFKRGASIDGAIRGVANEYNLSQDELRRYLIENKYILDKIRKKDLPDKLKKYNTKSLKKILKKHGLKTSGKRDKIEERIFKNNLIGFNYQLSSKSRLFYKNKKRRVNIFNDYLMGNYYFDEFNEFYMDNFRKKVAKIPIEFINLHISKSVRDKNHDDFISNSQILAKHFYIKENYKNMLHHVLKSFCINLNPVWKTGSLNGHVGVLLDTYDALVFLNDKIGKDRIISAYYVIWDSFNFEKIIVSKYGGYTYLKDILNQKSYDRINNDLNNRFYSNDDLKIKKITQKTLFDF